MDHKEKVFDSLTLKDVEEELEFELMMQTRDYIIEQLDEKNND